MRIAGLVQDSIVDGPGLRFVVFAQGCDKRCEGCHNPQSIDVNGGVEVPVDDIIMQLLSNPLTDGLTLSGGEPFLQAAECVKLAGAAKGKNLNVWVFTGYKFEELCEKAKTNPQVDSLLRLTDVLIDGGFILAERTLTLKWRGSQNQRIIDVPSSLASGKVVVT